MINVHDILETIKMIDEEYLDVRTITMGISLLDCCDSDIDKSCEKIYNKITRLAKDLVKTGEDIEREYGIPIINKRISVTPIAMLVAVSGGDPVKYAHTLERCAQTVGVNFIGGYSALVQKGCAAGDRGVLGSLFFIKLPDTRVFSRCFISSPLLQQKTIKRLNQLFSIYSR